MFDGEVSYPDEQDLHPSYADSLVESWQVKFCRTRARKGGGKPSTCRTRPTKATLKAKDKFLFFHPEVKFDEGEEFNEQPAPPVPVEDGEGIVDVTKHKAPIQRPGGQRVLHEIIYSITAGANPHPVMKAMQ